MQAVLVPELRTSQINAGAKVFSTPIHKLVQTFGNLHCRMFHRSISRPVNGKYHCWKCLKEFEAPW
jgi:hypothetical protein